MVIYSKLLYHTSQILASSWSRASNHRRKIFLIKYGLDHEHPLPQIDQQRTGKIKARMAPPVTPELSNDACPRQYQERPAGIGILAYENIYNQ
jgi:hypothetical protein